MSGAQQSGDEPGTAPAAPRTEGPLFAMAMTLAAIAVAVLYVRNHASWRDELQAWALVRASPTLPQLWENLRAEAHPLLWYLLLELAQLASHRPSAMLVLHCALACSAIWLLARHAPFPRLVRLLIGASYFVLFEYFAIARGYVLVELLAFAICAELRGKRRAWLLGLLLLLIAQTEVHGAILGGALCVAWAMLEWPAQRGATALRRLRPSLLAAVAAFGASALFCLYELARRTELPASPNGYIPVLETSDRVGAIYASLTTVFWTRMLGHQLLDAHVWLVLALALLLVVALTLTLLPSRPALVCWLLSGGLLLLLDLWVPNSVRHHGLLFVAFVAASWLAAPRGEPPPGLLAWATATRWSLPRAALLLTFYAQLAVAGPRAVITDLDIPHSAGLEAARFLEKLHLVDLPLVCDADTAAVSVLAQIDRPCFFPASDSIGTFTAWGPRRHAVSGELLVNAIEARLVDSPVVILVLNHPLQFTRPGVTLLGRFLASYIPDERFFIYRVTRVGAPPT